MPHDNLEAQTLPTSFKRLDSASDSATNKLAEIYKDNLIPKDKHLQVSVFVNKENQQIQNMSLEEIMEWAAKNNKKIAFYHGGIAWNGDIVGNKTERSDNPNGLASSILSLSSDMSPEEKREGVNKLSALEFLYQDGAEIVITLDPKEKKHVSSLRSDMVARKFLYEQIPDGAKKMMEAVSWSNGGFKDYQLIKQAFEKILYGNDKEPIKLDKDEAFATTWEAKEYMTCLRDINLFWGGAPAQASELATPFKLTIDRPGLKELNNKLRVVANSLVAKFGESNMLRKIIKQAVVSRLLEMGGNKALDRTKMEQFDSRINEVRQTMQECLGEGKVVNLLDLSGSVVEPTIQAFVSKDMAFILGEKAVTVAVDESSNAANESQHREIGRVGSKGAEGVLARLRKVATGESDPRFYVADPYKVAKTLPRMLNIYAHVNTSSLVE